MSKVRKSSKKSKKLSAKKKRKSSANNPSQTSRPAQPGALARANNTAGFITEREPVHKRLKNLGLDQIDTSQVKLKSGMNTCRNSSNPNPNESITSYIRNILKHQVAAADKKS
jgi:hypothetical protein